MRDKKGEKKAIPRHRKQCKEAADRQERAIEKRTRRQGKEECNER